MTKFLRLSTALINIGRINRVWIGPKAYQIYFSNPNISGFTLFGVGILSSNQESIHVMEKYHPEDYAIVSDWISSIDAGSREVSK